MQILKYGSTTYVTVGPAVAVGDGFTPTTNLASSAADEAYLIKHNSTSESTIGALTAYSSADGYYYLALTTANVDTAGRMSIVINDDSLILPIRHDYMVVNSNVYDSLFASSGTDLLDVNTEQINATDVLGTGNSANKWRG